MLLINERVGEVRGYLICERNGAFGHWEVQTLKFCKLSIIFRGEMPFIFSKILGF